MQALGAVLKVAHVPFTFAPDPVGGTEVYVEALAHGLKAHGIESVIVAPTCDDRIDAYEHNGLRVRRYCGAPKSENMLREIYGEGDPEAAASFGKTLDQEMVDVVHIHAFTRAVSVLSVRAAKQRGLPVFFTYHTPTVSCQRGTLMLQGKTVCDGVLTVPRCTSCSLEGHGMPRAVASVLGHFPRLFGRAVERANLSGGIWTALRMSELVRIRQEAFASLMREVDGVVALKEWVRTILVRNGVPRSKVILSPHGLAGERDTTVPLIDAASTPLRVAFLGRADAVKGADTLIKAVRAAPGLDLEVHLYGVTQSDGGEKYWDALKSLAARDARIAFLPPVPHDEVVTLLRGYHLLAVPSRWLETGPLVVLESFAAGTPVIGSDLGGIAEWVRHCENGLLVKPDSIPEWTDALRRCAKDRSFLSTLQRNVKPPRSMAEVAQEMVLLYETTINKPKPFLSGCACD